MAISSLKHTDQQFLQLMRIALGNAERFEVPPTAKEWEELLLMSAKQSVVGVAFSGVERLPKKQMPPIDIIMDWSAVVEHIKLENLNLNDVCVKVCNIFKQEKINACILKGQGMGALYDDPLRRSPGDIDVWMEGGKDKVVEYIMKNFPKAKSPGAGGHHISVQLKGTIDMEVHYIPAELYSPINFKKLKRWFADIEHKQWNTTVGLKVEGRSDTLINVPTFEFNQAFILIHLFHHWAFEGCGMKQIIDLYYLLEHSSPCKVSQSTIDDLGLKNFTRALMFVMQQLGLSEDKMLFPPHEKYGNLVLQDILSVGTVSAIALAEGEYSKEGKFHKFFRRFNRMCKMMPLAPTELIWVLPENLIGWATGKTKKGE